MSCNSPPTETLTGLAAQIHAIVDSSDFDGCKWGIQALYRNSSTLVYEDAGAHLFSVPASNDKLPSTYAAWLELGPTYTFSTNIAVSMASDDDASANVTLCGANDPSLTTAQLMLAAAQSVASEPLLAAAARVSVRSFSLSFFSFPSMIKCMIQHASFI